MADARPRRARKRPAPPPAPVRYPRWEALDLFGKFSVARATSWHEHSHFITVASMAGAQTLAALMNQADALAERWHEVVALSAVDALGRPIPEPRTAARVFAGEKIIFAIKKAMTRKLADDGLTVDWDARVVTGKPADA